MRVLDWFRWKIRKVNDWIDFRQLEAEVLQKINEFYPAPRYLVNGNGSYSIYVIGNEDDIPIAIVMEFEYVNTHNIEIECTYRFDLRFNKVFTKMYKRMKYLHTNLGKYVSEMMITTAILKCKHLSDLKNIDVIDYICVGERAEITSVDLVLNRSPCILIPTGVIIRWRSADNVFPVGYDNRYYSCEFSHSLLEEWKSLDIFGNDLIYRLYKMVHGYENTILCYAVDRTDDEERNWVYTK